MNKKPNAGQKRPLEAPKGKAPGKARRKNNPGYPAMPPHSDINTKEAFELRGALHKEKIMDLRLKGYSTPQIASILGLAEATVSQHVRNALELATMAFREKGEELRELELQRLDLIQRRLFPAAFIPLYTTKEDGTKVATLDEDGQPQYLVSHLHLAQLLKVMERRSALGGLDVAKPAGDDPEEAASAIMAAVRAMIGSTSGLPPEPMKLGGEADEEEAPTNG